MKQWMCITLANSSKMRKKYMTLKSEKLFSFFQYWSDSKSDHYCVLIQLPVLFRIVTLISGLINFNIIHLYMIGKKIKCSKFEGLSLSPLHQCKLFIHYSCLNSCIYSLRHSFLNWLIHSFFHPSIHTYWR